MFGRSRPRYGRQPLERVLVNLTTGRAFDGLLAADTGQCLMLTGASVVGLDGEATAVPGEVLIDVERIEFIQVAQRVPPAPLPPGAANQ